MAGKISLERFEARDKRCIYIYIYIAVKDHVLSKKNLKRFEIMTYFFVKLSIV